MADREVLQVDGGDPFAARLYDVLGAVDDAHVAVGIDRGDVAGVEEPVGVEDLAALALEVGAGHRRAAHHQAAEGLAVARQLRARIVDDLHLDAERRVPRRLLDVEPGIAREIGVFGLQRAQRADRAHLRHAPGMHHLGAIDVAELLRHGARAGRAADDHLGEIRQLLPGLLQLLQQHQPDRRHRGGMGHLVGGEEFGDRGAVHLGAWHDQRGAGHGRGEGEGPAVGVEHRHHRQHDVARRQAEHVGRVAHQRMDDVGAVRIDDALRVARRARRVAHAGGGVLVEALPGEVVVDLVQPVLVGDRVLQARLRHVRAVGEHHETLHRGQPVGELFHQRHEGQVHQHHAVFRMVGDPGDLLGEEARVQRVVDRADAGDAVPDLEVPPGVPGDRADAIAEFDPVLLQPLGDAQRVAPDVGIGRLDDGALDRPRDHLAAAVIEPGMVDDLRDQQRPVLHQTEHGFLRAMGGPARTPASFARKPSAGGRAPSTAGALAVRQGGETATGPVEPGGSHRYGPPACFAPPRAGPGGTALGRRLMVGLGFLVPAI